MYLEHNPQKVRRKARAGARRIIEHIEATLKNRRREITELEYAVSNEMIEFPGESMMQIMPSQDYTITMRMVVRKTK